ncbi:MAG TPA: serine hydrolase [Chitinophagaceae bacterium]|nr:serine hydrolase [Chitinophagaceae bacterium]
MKKAIALAGLSCCLAFQAQAQDSMLPYFVRDSLDTYVRRGLAAWKLPGLAVAIVWKGKVVLLKGYGYRSLKDRTLVDSNTLFMIGSNTKAFTATVLADLAGQGKFSMEDKVTRWMPEFRMQDSVTTADARVRDLLGHHLGMETFQGDFMYWTSDLTREEVIRHLGTLKPAYPFRTRYGYCNAAFVVAGQLVPRITGKTWEQEVQDLILDPLHMDRTLTLSSMLPSASNAALPYSFDPEDRLIPVAYNQIDDLAPAGSISSSVRDMSHWVLFQLANGKYGGTQVIPQSAVRSIREPQTIVGHSHYPFNQGYYTLYGSGWFLDEYAGRELVYHTGGVNGFLSSVTLVPSDSLGIVVLTNSDQNQLFQALKMEILDAFLHLPYRDYSDYFLARSRKALLEDRNWYNREMDTVSSHPSTALSLSGYTGTYINPSYGEISITLKSDSLQIHFSHHPQLIGRLLPLGGNGFLCVYSDPEMGVKRLPFSVEEGKVKAITVTVYNEVDNSAYVFTRE